MTYQEQFWYQGPVGRYFLQAITMLSHVGYVNTGGMKPTTSPSIGRLKMQLSLHLLQLPHIPPTAGMRACFPLCHEHLYHIAHLFAWLVLCGSVWEGGYQHCLHQRPGDRPLPQSASSTGCTAALPTQTLVAWRGSYNAHGSGTSPKKGPENTHSTTAGSVSEREIAENQRGVDLE